MMRLSLPHLLAFVAMLLGLTVTPLPARADGPPTAADLFVAPAGDDHWSGRRPEPNAGRTDGPFASPARAIAAVREIKAAEPGRTRPIVVEILGGTYTLPAPLVLTPEDSGTAKAPVIYRASPGQHAIVSGGSRLTGWKVAGDGRWRLNLDAPGKPAMRFTQLWVNDQRRFRPRLPSRGYLKIDRTIAPEGSPAASAPATKPASPPGHDRFGYAPGNFAPQWRNLQDVEVLAMQVWTMARLPVQSIDPKERVVQFRGRTQSGANHYALLAKGRYLIDNVFEALHEPGEWYLDNVTGELTYIPKAGEQPESATVVAPRLGKLLQLSGDPAANRYVEFVRFEDIEFAHANWVTPPTGWMDSQAESRLGAAVEAVGARNCVWRDCVVRHVGEYAFSFGKGCANDTLERCELFDLGGGGVKIGGGRPSLRPGAATQPATTQPLKGTHAASSQPNDDLVPAVDHITVRDCTIAHGGRLHPAAVGVWIEHSPFNVIDHNEIYDFYYSGVSVGWIWGYRTSAAHHNLITNNSIHTIGQGVLSDMGGVYTLGVSPGTRIEGNVISNVVSFGYGGWGLYTDEGSSYITMSNNLVFRTKSGGFHQHYGQENLIDNNIFALSSSQQLQRSREEDHLSFAFSHNIVYWSTGELLATAWRNGRFAFDHNLYWRTDGKPVMFAGSTFDQWREKGQDKGSRIADPLFARPAAGNFTLPADSPALGVGFKPFDTSKAGRLTKPETITKLPSVPRAFPTQLEF